MKVKSKTIRKGHRLGFKLLLSIALFVGACTIGMTVEKELREHERAILQQECEALMSCYELRITMTANGVANAEKNDEGWSEIAHSEMLGLRYQNLRQSIAKFNTFTKDCNCGVEVEPKVFLDELGKARAKVQGGAK